ncbi:MAG: VIT1/CCC1 transporter family protein [Thermoproteota archaeon]
MDLDEMKEPNHEVKNTIIGFQRNELTEHLIYRYLSKTTKDKNSEILRKISEDELKHYNEWKNYTGVDVSYKRLMLLKYLLVSRILGLTFAIKLMERGEKIAENFYSQISSIFPKAREIMREEEEHEGMLIGMVDEEKVKYVGSLVLGVNDALVELTGTLVGLTFTLQNNRLIWVAGLIVGIAASLSMAASEYLSQKSEKRLNPLRAALYTGMAYMLVVIMLTLPYLILENYLFSIILMLSIMTTIIFILALFISVVKEILLRKMFLEIILISLGVALISFAIGWAMRSLLGIEI